MIDVEDLSVRYGELQVLWGVSLHIPGGEITCVLGSNGAGKSTVMNSISGLVRPFRGRILLDGAPLHDVPAHRRVECGVAHVPERRQVFPSMSVMDNLLLGVHAARAHATRRETLESVFDLFPILAERRKQNAASLSGGEQQMLAIARGLMSRPRVILLDEPFLGLSPVMVDRTVAVMQRLRDQGLTVVFIEQQVRLSLEISRCAYVLEQGRVLLSGEASVLLRDGAVERAYMGRA